MAEGVGFEPTDPCGSAVFKTAAIVHSATPPRCALSLAEDITLAPAGDLRRAAARHPRSAVGGASLQPQLAHERQVV